MGEPAALPVTVLSAVIVNDMAELNIDASLIKTAGLVQKQEEMVQLQNGCICCTLRVDLLREVARLARSGAFDYCVIESTGISEPMQVAETFTMAMEQGWDDTLAMAEAEEAAATNMANDATIEQEEPAVKKVAKESTKTVHTHDTRSNKHIHATSIAPAEPKTLHTAARLDTCVTVVDAVNTMAVLNDVRTVQEADHTAPPEDQRSLAELLVDQIEFANVILLNKADLVSSRELQALKSLIVTMNPGARVVVTRHSRVDLKDVLNTGLFNMEEAAASAGWLRSMHEDLRPESEEYGITSFVYRRRRPFHPQRLFELISPSFLLQQHDAEEEGDDDDNEADAETHDDEAATDKPSDVATESMDEQEDNDSLPADLGPRLAAAKADSPFAAVVRSKGFLWLANRNDVMGSWSQAGIILTISPESPWLCLLPADALEGMDTDAIKEEMANEHGDRRQEIVFIGHPINTAVIEAALDACLVTDTEWAGAAELTDDFEPWPAASEYAAEDDEEEEEEEEEEGME